MRNLDQASQVVEKTIIEINRNLKVTDELITRICKKNKVNESHIRVVAGFPKKIRGYVLGKARV